VRFVSWNCSMALHKKFEALMSLEPDIAVVCECAEPDRLRKKIDAIGIDVDSVWVGANPNKGLAVFAFNGYRLRLATDYDDSLHFVAPVRVDGPQPFNLLAVWAQNASAGIRRKAEPGPLRIALDRYRDFLTCPCTLAAGDFNNNILWDKPGWPMNHAEAVAVLDGYGLVSAYHESRRESQGGERTPTHYWRDRKKDGPTYHIDYVFLPRAWLSRVREMNVGTFEEWCGSGLSDHVPLLVDVSL